MTPLFGFFRLADWLSEENETRDLVSAAAAGQVAVSDGAQVVVDVSGIDRITIDVEALPAEPRDVDEPPPAGQGSRVLPLTCPSGSVYLENPTAVVDELPGVLASAGDYRVRVAWRGRQPSPDPAVREQYLIQLWRVGEVPDTSDVDDA